MNHRAAFEETLKVIFFFKKHLSVFARPSICSYLFKLLSFFLINSSLAEALKDKTVTARVFRTYFKAVTSSLTLNCNRNIHVSNLDREQNNLKLKTTTDGTSLFTSILMKWWKKWQIKSNKLNCSSQLCDFETLQDLISTVRF